MPYILTNVFNFSSVCAFGSETTPADMPRKQGHQNQRSTLAVIQHHQKHGQQSWCVPIYSLAAFPKSRKDCLMTERRISANTALHCQIYLKSSVQRK